MKPASPWSIVIPAARDLKHHWSQPRTGSMTDALAPFAPRNPAEVQQAATQLLQSLDRRDAQGATYEQEYGFSMGGCTVVRPPWYQRVVVETVLAVTRNQTPADSASFLEAITALRHDQDFQEYFS